MREHVLLLCLLGLVLTATIILVTAPEAPSLAFGQSGSRKLRGVRRLRLLGFVLRRPRVLALISHGFACLRDIRSAGAGDVVFYAMLETGHAPSCALFDVTAIASLRKQLGHAAIALKAIGICSGAIVPIYLSDPLGWPFAFTVSLLTPGCAFLIAKRLRSGRTWAVGLAGTWFIVFAGFLVFDAMPKAVRAGLFEVYTLLGMTIFLVCLYFLARGLITFVTYRVRPRHVRMPPDLLALNPYEEGLRIKQRPKFLSKTNMGAYGFLFLSPLPFLLAWLGQQGEFQIYSDEAQLVGAWIGSLMISLVLIAWGARIYRRARRAAMLPGSALMKRDSRPIVLYLRSFHDDSQIKLRARAANGRILPERLVKIPFEEVVTDHLWGYGPVLAIGDPRMKFKRTPLGAARDYVDDSSWQQKVTELVQDAAMIVVVAGGTEGLAWEIDTIAKLGLVWKLVLLLPPVRVQELQARWQALAMHVGSNVLPPQIDFACVRAVIFPKGEAALIAGKKRDDWTYEAVLDDAALTIASERDAVHPTAPSPQHLSPSGRVRQVLGTVASGLASMAAGALLLALVAILIGVGEYRKKVARPYAPPGYQRDSFITEMMQACREANPQLSAEQRTRYCTCFANELADVVTAAELTKDELLEAKAKSVAGSCSEKTLGQ